MVRRILSLLITLTVCSAFALHSAGVPHDHPHGFGDGHVLHTHAADTQAADVVMIEESTHATEEKSLYLLLATLAAGAILFLNVRPHAPVDTRQIRPVSIAVVTKRVSYLLLLFARGILHSKVH